MQFFRMNSTSIKQTLELLEKKEISSVDITQKCLDAIETKDKKINAFITLNKEALAEARQADLRRARGERGTLLGIPIALKDIYSTKGLKTTAGSRVLDEYVPPYDATVTKKLKDAGVVILGKTNLDAWAHGSSGENSDYGDTHNPYDLNRTPGGSSSGSAASVASGMAYASTGTDTGGSIRLPAGFCNLVGLKPTYGRVSRYGIIAMGSSFDSIGHFAHTVSDSALLLTVTAGHDPYDGTTGNLSVPDYQENLGKSIKGMKIGVVKEFIGAGIDNEVRVSFEKACKTLESLGCEIVEISLPHITYALEVYYILVPAELSSNLGRMDGVRFGNNRNHFSAEAKRRIMIGTYTLSSGYYDAFYNKALKVRRLIIDDFTQAFEKVDAIISPTSPTPPFKLGEKTQDPLSMYLSDMYVCPMNLAGVPAITVPAQPAHNLPCGVQFVGKQFDEKTLFTIAYAYEQVRGPIHLKLQI